MCGSGYGDNETVRGDVKTMQGKGTRDHSDQPNQQSGPCIYTCSKRTMRKEQRTENKGQRTGRKEDEPRETTNGKCVKIERCKV